MICIRMKTSMSWLLGVSLVILVIGTAMLSTAGILLVRRYRRNKRLANDGLHQNFYKAAETKLITEASLYDIAVRRNPEKMAAIRRRVRNEYTLPDPYAGSVGSIPRRDSIGSSSDLRQKRSLSALSRDYNTGSGTVTRKRGVPLSDLLSAYKRNIRDSEMNSRL